MPEISDRSLAGHLSAYGHGDPLPPQSGRGQPLYALQAQPMPTLQTSKAVNAGFAAVLPAAAPTFPSHESSGFVCAGLPVTRAEFQVSSGASAARADAAAYHDMAWNREQGAPALGRGWAAAAAGPSSLTSHRSPGQARRPPPPDSAGGATPWDLGSVTPWGSSAETPGAGASGWTARVCSAGADGPPSPPSPPSQRGPLAGDRRGDGVAWRWRDAGHPGRAAAPCRGDRVAGPWSRPQARAEASGAGRAACGGAEGDEAGGSGEGIGGGGGDSGVCGGSGTACLAAAAVVPAAVPVGGGGCGMGGGGRCQSAAEADSWAWEGAGPGQADPFLEEW